MDAYNSPTTKTLYKSTQVIWYLFGILEILLAFRVVLKLFGANAEAGFSSFIYNVTYVFTAPFTSVFGVTTVEGSVFEWTTILAMFVYWVIAAGILKLILMSRTVSTPEAARKLSDQE